jgi:Gram-negative bacterial TonB protein C-terminal
MNRLLASLLVCAISYAAHAQNPAHADAPHLVVSKLPPPVYPPIALAAGVSGDVELSVKLSPDGAIEAVDAISGPLMLRQPALDDVKRSKFECGGCVEAVTQFRLVYRFDLAEASMFAGRDDSYPRITQTPEKVTITGQPWGACDPAVSKVRSLKCLFHWRCGWR